MTFVPQGNFTFNHADQSDSPNWSPATAKANFDSRAIDLKTTVNNLITALQSSTVGDSAASLIGSEAVTGLSGTTIRAQLVDFLAKLKAVTDGSSGADLVGATAISGWTGSTVQALLESAKTYVDTIVLATANLADGSVTTSKIADLAVTAGKIADLSISAAKIVDSTITAAKIQTGALDGRYYTETELNNGQLDNRYYTETELNAGQLDTRYYTETELNAGQLDTRYFTETEIQSTAAGTGGSRLVGSETISGVTGTTVYAQLVDLKSQINAAVTGTLPDGSITSAKLADSSVISTKLGDGSVTSAKLVDGSVTTNKLGDGAVASAKLADVSVTTAKLVDGSVTDSKFGNRMVDDTIVPTDGTSDTPTRLWSKLANLIKGITGKANWYVPPVTSIENLNNNKLNTSAYTAADVLTKIKTVDGAGSGLDADLVKGYVPLNKAGDNMGGTLGLFGSAGTNEFSTGNGDGASYTLYNFAFKGWFGMAMKSYNNDVMGFYDFRQGKWDVQDGYYVNGTKNAVTRMNGTVPEYWDGGAWVPLGSAMMVASNNVKSSNNPEQTLATNARLIHKFVPRNTGEIVVNCEMWNSSGSTTVYAYTQNSSRSSSGSNALLQGSPSNDYRAVVGTEYTSVPSAGGTDESVTVGTLSTAGVWTAKTVTIKVNGGQPIYFYLSGTSGNKVRNLQICYDLL